MFSKLGFSQDWEYKDIHEYATFKYVFSTLLVGSLALSPHHILSMYIKDFMSFNGKGTFCCVLFISSRI